MLDIKQKRLFCSKWFGVLTVLLLLIIVCIDIYLSSYGLHVTHYEVLSSKINTRIRIVQLTDLHDSVFGENNQKLIDLVIAQEPDLVFITGDMINNHKTIDESRAIQLIQKLSDIVPVYVSMGNQELDACDNDAIDFYHLYEDAGACVLEHTYKDIDFKGEVIRIGGLYGYCQQFRYSMGSWNEVDSKFLLDFQDTSNCKLLLCHIPLCWMSQANLSNWDVDFIFSGHVHGGQVRIPFVGGLWDPDKGWFPGRDCGLYTSNTEDWKTYREELLDFMEKNGYDSSYYKEHNTYSPSTLILSRGLGNTDWVPRFNNVPEVVVVDILPEN